MEEIREKKCSKSFWGNKIFRAECVRTKMFESFYCQFYSFGIFCWFLLKLLKKFCHIYDITDGFLIATFTISISYRERNDSLLKMPIGFISLLKEAIFSANCKVDASIKRKPITS